MRQRTGKQAGADHRADRALSTVVLLSRAVFSAARISKCAPQRGPGNGELEEDPPKNPLFGSRWVERTGGTAISSIEQSRL